MTGEDEVANDDQGKHNNSANNPAHAGVPVWPVDVSPTAVRIIVGIAIGNCHGEAPLLGCRFWAINATPIGSFQIALGGSSILLVKGLRQLVRMQG
ncbi:MAG: hypothetical protein P4M09_30860 [Devosia sp.]|nr:hypothetical protein [Devosia sp.]